MQASMQIREYHSELGGGWGGGGAEGKGVTLVTGPLEAATRRGRPLVRHAMGGPEGTRAKQAGAKQAGGHSGSRPAGRTQGKTGVSAA